MYKKDLALNNLQWLRCHKNQTKPDDYLKKCSSELTLVSTNQTGFLCVRHFFLRRPTDT